MKFMPKFLKVISIAAIVFLSNAAQSAVINEEYGLELGVVADSEPESYMIAKQSKGGAWSTINCFARDYQSWMSLRGTKKKLHKVKCGRGYKHDEGVNRAGPNRCNQPYECDGLRKCYNGWCTGRAR